ncbi:MAG: transporter substrate-binding domain-containing protein [Clostridia bacterium]|nr:transporter substrate-binding domain-containing protein [Clostridia bacterium]
MKKFLAFVVSALIAGVCAVTMAACSSTQKVKIIEIPLSSEQYGVAIAKENTELKAEVNEVIELLAGEGIEYNGKTVTFNSLYNENKEASDKNEGISIGDVKTASTNRANELVVATELGFAPFEYTVGNQICGVDMHIAKIIADKLGKELVIVHMDFKVVVSSVAEGLADIALAGLTISPDRLETVDFSTPYYDTTQYIAVSADNTAFDECKTAEDVEAVLAELENATAGAAEAQTGYFYLTGSEDLGFDGFPNLEVKTYSTIALAVQDLVNGKLQVVSGDKDTLTAAVNSINKV